MTATDRYGNIIIRCGSCEQYYPGDMEACPSCQPFPVTGTGEKEEADG